MNILSDLLQPTGVFLLGLLIRLLVFVAVFAVAAIPVLAVVWAVVGLKRLRERWLGLVTLDGLVLAERRSYTPGHEWLDERPGGRLRVGLDDLAAHLFHGATVVRLPRPGTHLAAGLPAATIACGDRTATIPAPVDGVVTLANAELMASPELLERSPYDRGWLFAMEPAPGAKRDFPRGEEARRWFRAETARFTRFLEGELGLAAADGGELIVPAATLLPEEKWHAAVESFLKA